MLIEGARPKLVIHSRNGRRMRRITSGSSLGYLNVGWEARAPVRLNATCTVTGMSMATAAAQNWSSSGVGYPLALGKAPSWMPLSPSSAQCCLLANGAMDVGNGHPAHADKTVRRDGAVLFR